VSGNQDTNVAQVASALPIAANETTNARTRTMVTGPDGPTPPARHARVELDEPEHGAHGGGLARAVGPQEPGQPPRPGDERAGVEGHPPAEPLGRTVELQHRRSLPRSLTGAAPPS
jgi:hypothetical protein